MEDRIIELENKLAFQEHTIQELNDVVSQQQKEIMSLRLSVEKLNETMRSLTPSNIARQAEETPPPHY